MIPTGAARHLSFAGWLKLPALLLRSARPLSSAIAGTVSLTAVMLRTRRPILAALAGLAMFTVTMFGFVVNDIFDFKKDVAAGVQRPIATCDLSRHGALFFAIFLLLAAACLSALINSGGGILALTIVALVLYTPCARHIPLSKGVYVAALCLSPLYYAAVVTRSNASLAAYAVLALFVLGRESMMDAHELDGDRQANIKTIAVLLGQPVSRWLGAAMMVVSLSCLNLVARGAVGRTAALLSVLSLLCVLAWPRIDEGRRVSLSRLPMLAAAVAVASG